ncbi:MAG: hypothetical protein KAS32_05785 [Candidatus Peribacteraceae bacterium]|nr:hypothetical protein [Candidatus Peribacteraceae bacterium]
MEDAQNEEPELVIDMIYETRGGWSCRVVEKGTGNLVAVFEGGDKEKLRSSVERLIALNNAAAADRFTTENAVRALKNARDMSCVSYHLKEVIKILESQKDRMIKALTSARRLLDLEARVGGVNHVLLNEAESIERLLDDVSENKDNKEVSP